MLKSHFKLKFKAHVSFAITMTVEGFYPISSAGFTIRSFSSFKQALPLITLIVSMFSSSFGMSKFFLQGPTPILSKGSPMNGLISLPFICTLLINCMFGCRVVCIENAFFSSYRYQQYRLNEKGLVQKMIDPIFPPEYRLLVYFMPSLVSFFINGIRLRGTLPNIGHHIKKYPQLLLACCFSPFIFEGCNENSIRIWKLGSIVNAFFIGCLPQIILVFMDYYRGVVKWDFISFALEPEYIYENNDALFKSKNGNSLFALISGVFFFFLIIFTFFTDKIFKNRAIYCKCFSILCCPCPNNFLNLNPTMITTQHFVPSSPLQNNPTSAKIDQDPKMIEMDSEEQPEVAKRSLIQIYVYSKDKAIRITGKQKEQKRMEQRKVTIEYFIPNLRFY